MKKEKEFVEAEIVTEGPRRQDNFGGNFVFNQMTDFKKPLSFRGWLFLIFWIIVFILILWAIISLFFWLLPAIFASFLVFFIVGFIFKIFFMLKK